MRSLETVLVDSDVDVVRVRRAVTFQAERLGFSVLDRTRLVTAASELARNMLKYAGGGRMRLEEVFDPRRGLKATFEDRGPGILNLEEALADGFSSSRGLGLGLGGARRLSDHFEISSSPDSGTRVTIARWL